MTTHGFVEYEKSGHVATVTMNRPERLNARGAQMGHDLARAWYEFVNDDDARVGVLTGAGRIFCAGRDIQDQAAGGPPPLDAADAPVARMEYLGVPDTNKPIISAVNGGAWGFGWYMVLGSDIAVCADDARFAMSELPTGIIGPAFVPILCNLPWLPGVEVVLRGHTISAQRAYELGLANHMVPPDEVLPRALELAEEIAGLPPVHVQTTKEQLRIARPPHELVPERDRNAGRERLPQNPRRHARGGAGVRREAQAGVPGSLDACRRGSGPPRLMRWRSRTDSAR